MYNTEFDSKAPTWDKDPVKVDRAHLAAEIIKEHIPLNQNMIGLEPGCGTGLLSFNLQSDLGQIDLVDISEGMLSELNKKIAENNITNMSTFNLDLTKEENSQMAEKYDLAYTLMTLHHIVDVDGFLGTMHKILKPEGYFCIFDLVQEDGSFHSEELFPFEGHNGFDKADLEEKLLASGFHLKHYDPNFFKNRKTFNDGHQKDYPLFALIAQK